MKLNEERLFAILINNFKFVIEEFFIEELKENRCIALNYSDNGVFGVIFSDDGNKDIIGKSAFNYLYGKNKPFGLNNVILTNEEKVTLSNKSKELYSSLYLNKNNENIIYSDNNCEFLIQIINSIKTNEKNKPFFNMPSKITALLIIINIVMFIVSAIMSKSIVSIDTNVLISLGAKVNHLIQAGQYYRLITAMFLHGGIMHILFNMYALYALGNLVENIFGKTKYLVIYFISGILSVYASYLFSPYISVGASGAIFGLLGACLIYAILSRETIGKQFLFDISSVIILNIVIGISTPTIDNFAHFGGLITGILLALLFMKLKLFKN